MEWEQMGSLGIVATAANTVFIFWDAADAATVHKHKQVATLICIDNVFILNFKAQRHSARGCPPCLTPCLPRYLRPAVAA